MPSADPQYVHPSTANKEALKKLKAAIEAKRAADKKVAVVEASIANFEGSYLQETAASGGNIIKGFDQYMKLQPSGRRRFDVHDSDRLFSMSSGSYLQSMELLANERVEQARWVNEAQSPKNIQAFRSVSEGETWLDAEYAAALARQTSATAPLRGERQASESTVAGSLHGGGLGAAGGGGHKKRKREEREREKAEREREEAGTPGASAGGTGGRKKHRNNAAEE